ncbi:hypothetical protein V6N13_041499 [Hibiscus sabdariffa]|uniref:Uncharacterized protein n=1 Tax=Hibiscus sabdariffa TaxID=183260 RepID=A0ABR2RC24_9ROSI
MMLSHPQICHIATLGVNHVIEKQSYYTTNCSRSYFVSKVAAAPLAITLLSAVAPTVVLIPTADPPTSVTEKETVASTTAAPINSIPLAFITARTWALLQIHRKVVVAMNVSAIEKTNGKTTPCTFSLPMLSEFDAWLSKKTTLYST